MKCSCFKTEEGRGQARFEDVAVIKRNLVADCKVRCLRCGRVFKLHPKRTSRIVDEQRVFGFGKLTKREKRREEWI